MIRPVSIRALPHYRVYVKFSDGAEGEVDLSDLAGKGIFAAWNNYNFFERVHLGAHRQIQWSDEIELCPYALYMKLTGKTLDELFPELARENIHA